MRPESRTQRPAQIGATLSSQVESVLRTAIVTGQLEAGAKLTMTSLVERYGVSVTPLREALQRLSEQGLVVIDARRGTRVTSMSIELARDLYAARLLIEPSAAGLATQRGDESWRAAVDSSMRELRAVSLEPREQSGSNEEADHDRRWALAHTAFHSCLVEACGSMWILRIVQLLHDHCDRYRFVAAHGSLLLPRVTLLDEHERLCERAVAGDADGVVEATRTHLELSLEVLETALAPGWQAADQSRGQRKGEGELT